MFLQKMQNTLQSVNRTTTHMQATYHKPAFTHYTKIKYVVLHNILTACNIEEGALFGGNPQVGGASIKNNSEGLWWSTDGNVAIILSLMKSKNTEH